MKRIEIYDPAMCCSTGVCGPNVNPELVRFAADLKWLQEQGVEVRRFNLSQSPAAFVHNEFIRSALTERGEQALPFLLVNDQPACSGRYPKREELCSLLDLKAVATVTAPKKPSCCRGGKC